MWSAGKDSRPETICMSTCNIASTRPFSAWNSSSFMGSPFPKSRLGNTNVGLFLRRAHAVHLTGPGLPTPCTPAKMRYTRRVTSKNVIGFDSPLHRGESRINRKVCGFSFGRSSFGSADRRAQALPVCLRDARSVNLSALPPSLTVGRQLYQASTGGQTWHN
jgi:hypothetical protein